MRVRKAALIGILLLCLNHHFDLVSEVNENGVRVYISDLNYTNPQLSWEEFSQTWDSAALVVSTRAGSRAYDYNSGDNEFIFGYGWIHSYQLKIKEYPNHVALYRENNTS
ncbi:MAG: hypothetical protein V1662_05900 [Candidatus Omnitrophota bacterium]